MIIEITPPPVHSRLERHSFRWRAVVVVTFPDKSTVRKQSEWYFRKALAELEREYLTKEGQSWLNLMTPIIIERMERGLSQ